jgi:hypothetical protein
MDLMSNLSSLALATSGLALCLVPPALAQMGTTSIGTLNATIGDASYAGETLEVPSEGTATAEFRSFGPVVSITIQAHDPNTESMMNNVFSFEISLMGTDASATVADKSISYWPGGMSAPFYMSEDSGVEPVITFDTLSLDDDAAANGSFSALLCRKDDFFSETDTDDCLQVEGTFQTALHKGD